MVDGRIGLRCFQRSRENNAAEFFEHFIPSGPLGKVGGRVGQKIDRDISLHKLVNKAERFFLWRNIPRPVSKEGMNPVCQTFRKRGKAFFPIFVVIFSYYYSVFTVVVGVIGFSCDDNLR